MEVLEKVALGAVALTCTSEQSRNYRLGLSIGTGAAFDPSVTVEGAATAMIYTSGTTGRPKGAVRENSGNPENMMKWIMSIGYTPEDIHITTGPLYHSGPASFMGIGLAMGQAFEAAGFEVWVTDVDRVALDACPTGWRAKHVDVSDEGAFSSRNISIP